MLGRVVPTDGQPLKTESPTDGSFSEKYEGNPNERAAEITQ